jgi:spermidine/putrescine transport system substrate-binding protein
MRGLRIPILIVIIFSFTLGIFWGLRIQRARLAAEGRIQPGTVLRVLTLPRVFPAQLIKTFQESESTRLELTVASSPEELWSKLEGGNFDVVTLFSDQATAAAQGEFLEPLSLEQVPALRHINADFEPASKDPAGGHVAPVLWGVTGLVYNSSALSTEPASWAEILSSPKLRGQIVLERWSASLAPVLGALMPNATAEEEHNWRKLIATLKASGSIEKEFHAKSLEDEESSRALVIQTDHSALASAAPHWRFVLPEEGASFWTLSLAIPKSALHPHEATKLIEFMLSKDSGSALVAEARAATTLSVLEASELHFSLKPSYLRSFPLTRLRPISGALEMNEARAIHDAL